MGQGRAHTQEWVRGGLILKGGLSSLTGWAHTQEWRILRGGLIFRGGLIILRGGLIFRSGPHPSVSGAIVGLNQMFTVLAVVERPRRETE